MRVFVNFSLSLSLSLSLSDCLSLSPPPSHQELDGYYSVYTPEGEAIAQVIAGYIDLMMRKQQPQPTIHDVTDSNAEPDIVELERYEISFL